MEYQVPQPGEEQLRLVPEMALQRRAVLAFEGFEPVADSGGFSGRQHRQGVIVAITPILLDRASGQCLGPVAAG